MTSFGHSGRMIEFTYSDGQDREKVTTTPVIHKNFNKLHQTIIELNKDKYRVFIQSEDEKQTERYRSIFRDLGQEVDFEEVNHELVKGFIDNESKIAVLLRMKSLHGESEIFKRPKRIFQRKHNC